MSKRRLYPARFGDRVLFWSLILFTLFNWFVRAVSYSIGELPAWYHWLILVFVGPAMLVVLYYIQDLPKEGAENPYAKVIANIDSMGRQLTELAEFLKIEQRKVAESEATLKRLRDEKTELEPVVTTNREVVNAILTAHVKTTAKKAWKERVIGFMSGVLASFVVALLFEFFRH